MRTIDWHAINERHSPSPGEICTVTTALARCDHRLLLFQRRTHAAGLCAIARAPSPEHRDRATCERGLARQRRLAPQSVRPLPKHVFLRVVHGPSLRPLSSEFCTVNTTDKTKQDDIDVTLTPRRRNAGQNPFGPFHL